MHCYAERAFGELQDSVQRPLAPGELVPMQALR
jgi:hypothetical protein